MDDADWDDADWDDDSETRCPECNWMAPVGALRTEVAEAPGTVSD